MKNHWKKAFIILISIVIVLCVLGAILISYAFFLAPKSSTGLNNNTQTVPLSNPVFTISADKNELTKLVNQKLNKKKEGNITYQVNIQNDVRINGNISVFGGKIPFIMAFDPQVTKSGEVVLKETTFRLGRVALPEDEVLNFIKTGTNLPNWVTIEPYKKQIDVNLSKYPIQNSFYLKADKIDLKTNTITFSVYQKK